jgi:hypothetical protein
VDFIQTNTTPIIIYDKFNETPETYSLAAPESARAFVEKWRKSWSEKDINTYATCYDDNFKDVESGRNKAQLIEYKGSLNQVYSYIKVELKNLSIYRHPRYWVAQFIQEYAAPGKSLKGIKRLYLKDGGNGNYTILSEEYVPLTGVSYVPELRKRSKSLPVDNAPAETAPKPSE